MGDLILSAGILACASLAALWIGWRVSHRSTAGTTFRLALLALAGFLIYAFYYHGTWQIARILPFSGAIVLGNGIPVGGAFFAGIALGQKSVPGWRRRGLATLILIPSCYSVACCFMGQLPVQHHSQIGGSSFEQSRRSSCGACCAAALLQSHGIDASEEEMLDLCLTSYRGSPALGVYRGLKLKTAGTDWDVEVVTGTADELVATRGPLLLRVLLFAGWAAKSDDGRYVASTRRMEHAVLLVDVPDVNHLAVLDPAIPSECRLLWNIDQLRECSLGEALRLVRRPAGHPTDEPHSARSP